MSQTRQGNAPGKQRPSAVVFKTISTAFRSPFLDENPEMGGRFRGVFRGRQKILKRTRNPQREVGDNTKRLSRSAVFNINKYIYIYIYIYIYPPAPCGPPGCEGWFQDYNIIASIDRLQTSKYIALLTSMFTASFSAFKSSCNLFLCCYRTTG